MLAIAPETVKSHVKTFSRKCPSRSARRLWLGHKARASLRRHFGTIARYLTKGKRLRITAPEAKLEALLVPKNVPP
jgi:hypothetical protein